MIDAEQRALNSVSLEECIALTRELVRIDTSKDDSRLANVLKDLLRSEGIECWFDPVPTGGANVIARLSGISDGPGLLYSAHMDTVPVGDANVWSSPPLCGSLRDGRIYGRGSSDCKGGLAAMTLALIALKRAESSLRRQVTLTAVTGETKGNLGTLHLARKGLDADFAVVGEYSMATNIATTYRGIVWGRLTVRGKTIHPGRRELGIDAIEQFLDYFAPALREFSTAYAHHPLVPDPSLTITRLNAGHATNAIADRCTATFDIRIVPGQRAEDVWSELAKVVEITATRAVATTSMELIHSLDPFETPVDDPYVAALSGCIEDISGSPAGIIGKTGMCDGNILANRLGIPSVSYGPGNPSGTGVDEYCDITALDLSLRAYILLALRQPERAPLPTVRE